MRDNFRLTSCSTPSRSRSRWRKAIRSVSMEPSATHESGHFYFAQTGHSHFAPTPTIGELTSSVNTVSLTQFRDNPWGSSCRRVKFGEDRHGQEIAATCRHAEPHYRILGVAADLRRRETRTGGPSQ